MYDKYSDKINYLNNNQNKEVLSYLKERLNNAYIEILRDKKTPIMSLFNTSKLMGWCWQTTETAILFLDDKDYIERGYLDIDVLQHNYYHSWICFKYNNQEYVFDPCLNIICLKEKYTKEFKAKVLAQVYASNVKKVFIDGVLNHKPEEKKYNFLKCFMTNEEYENYIKLKANEVVLKATEDINEPFYRSGAGYRAQIENKKIKHLTVHYYYTDC